jgi:hypothetical protein
MVSTPSGYPFVFVDQAMQNWSTFDVLMAVDLVHQGTGAFNVTDGQTRQIFSACGPFGPCVILKETF